MATITGTPSDETLTGTPESDRLEGHLGHDTLLGDGGGDLLLGGFGNDSMVGGAGDDIFDIIDDDGNDTLIGGTGDDQLRDRAGSNVLDGGDGADLFMVEGAVAAGGGSTATGGAGRDEYRVFEPSLAFDYVVTDFAAGAGGELIDVENLLTGSATNGFAGGNPFAGQGFLRLFDTGPDTELQWDRDGSAGTGFDWVTVLTLQNRSGASLTSDNFIGGIPPDGSSGSGQLLDGTDSDDTLSGTFFNDTILGRGGFDRLKGHFGDDTLDGGGGGDILLGGFGNDSMVGGAGDDIFDIIDDAGNDTLIGGTGDDQLRDRAGSNVLDGGDGADLFMVESAVVAGGGNTATGGAGRDEYRVFEPSLAFDYVVTDFAAGAGGDLIDVESLLTASAANGYAGGNPFADEGFLRLFDTGPDTRLQWDRDGAAGTSSDWVTVLTLQNRSGLSLTADNFIGSIPPDGSSGSGQLLDGTDAGETLSGGFSNDTIVGRGGADRLEGHAGDDTMEGGAEADMLLGGFGNDSMLGGAGDDIFDIIDDAGNDTLMGGTGDDQLRDRAGSNVLDGGDGADLFMVEGAVVAGGGNTATGGAGRDEYRLFEPSLAFEYVVTDFAVGAGGDLIDVENLLTGSAIYGFAGGNPFDAGQGFLRLFDTGSDTELQWDRDGAAGTGYDWVSALTLQNRSGASLTSDNFVGQLVVGTTGDDSLVGGLGNDTVQGLAGNDTLDGSLGRDVLQGGSGDDLYFVDHANDVVDENSNSPGALLLPGESAAGPGMAGVSGITDTVIAAVNYSLTRAEFVENLTLSGAAARATGNVLANKLTGNAGNDTLSGGDGNDTLHGGAGSDSLAGGAGNDTLVWGATDRFDGGAGNDTLKLTAGNLNLVALPNANFRNVESINMAGGGNNILTLSRSDVLDFSSTTNTLKVLGDSGDVLNAAGFVEGADSGGFHRYTKGAAVLLVDTDVTVNI